jgi:hypothetical protein
VVLVQRTHSTDASGDPGSGRVDLRTALAQPLGWHIGKIAPFMGMVRFLTVIVFNRAVVRIETAPALLDLTVDLGQ